MQKGYSMVRDSVKRCPLPLLHLQDKKLLEYAEKMLPYSTGIEIECSSRFNSFTTNNIFKERIPELLEVDCCNNEMRFRIPKGIKGLIVLYKVSETLKDACLLNPKSGIHYHVDFTDVSKKDFVKIYNAHEGRFSWILKSLKSWNYTGRFNEWEICSTKKAVKFHSHYQTVEFRIGEMTFDYELLIKRIVHCQNICRSLKSSLKRAVPEKVQPKVATYPRVIGRIEL